MIFSVLFLVGCTQAPVVPDLDYENVTQGMSKPDVIKILGQPESSQKLGSEEILMYDGVRVALSDDKVINKYETDELSFFKVDISVSRWITPTLKIAKVVMAPKGVKKGDHDFLKTKKFVSETLVKKGYDVIDDAHMADTLVQISYNESASKEKSGFFTRHLVLDAVDPTNHNRHLWQVNLTSDGKTSKFSEVLPYLVAASEEYIEHSTSNTAKTFIFKNDPRVKAMASRHPKKKERGPATAGN